jgi:hypothetical protein
MFAGLIADFTYNCTIGLDDVMELITPACEGTCLNCLESHCIQMYEHQGLLIEEQNLYDTACDIYAIVHAYEADCMLINRSLFRVLLGTIHSLMECILSV